MDSPLYTEGLKSLCWGRLNNCWRILRFKGENNQDRKSRDTVPLRCTEKSHSYGADYWQFLLRNMLVQNTLVEGNCESPWHATIALFPCKHLFHVFLCGAHLVFLEMVGVLSGAMVASSSLASGPASPRLAISSTSTVCKVSRNFSRTPS